MPRSASDEALWIFGYGSLVWRPDFPFDERQHGYIEGWSRRFWQGSTDHRGTPEAPGRVVTLVECADAQCFGTAYRVAAADRDSVLTNLDHRERGGFERHRVVVSLTGPGPIRVDALVYVATPANENFLGPAPVEAIVRQVLRCTGPSGPNVEYVVRLAEALRAMGAHDDHVFEIADRVTSVI